MQRPRVSIIIPTFNRLALLREALDSIAAQTFTDYEVIVIDDGSTEDIAGGVADHPTRPIVIRQTRSGPAAARNRGVAEAKAEIVAFLDSDDLWEPTKLEVFLDTMVRRPNASIVYGPMHPIDANRNSVPGRTKPCHDGDITVALFLSSFVHVPTVVCPRQLLVESGGFNPDLPVCEDYDLWLRLSDRHEFALVPKPLAHRRLHGDRLSKSSMARNLAVKARVLKAFFEMPNRRREIPADISNKRLGRVFFVAGREALRAGNHDDALALSAEARTYRGSRWRTMPITVAATLMKLVGRSSGRVNVAPKKATSAPQPAVHQ